MPWILVAEAKVSTELDMSKMSDLYTQIQELLDQGKFPYEIAEELGIPEEWVDEVVFDQYCAQPDNV